MRTVKKIKLSILLLTFIGATSYLFSNTNLKNINIKNLISLDKKKKATIKKYFLPYRLISQQEARLSDQQRQLLLMEPFLAEVEYYKKLNH